MRRRSDRATRCAVNRVAAICIVAMLCVSCRSVISGDASQFVFSQDDPSLKPGTYWTLASKWRWNASGVGDQIGSRVEAEDWNDTLSIKQVSSSDLVLGLKRSGHGSLEASGSFIIGSLQSDSWKIDKEYSIKVDAATFRGADGKPIRWIVDAEGLDASGSVPQMWVDRNYGYTEVQFRVSGSKLVMAGGFAFDTWAVSYRNLTTGYWSASGNHSTGFKEETLRYDKRHGLLLQAEYRGTYGLKTYGGAWNETETCVASTISSNLEPPAEIENANLPSALIFVSILALAALILSASVLYRRKRTPVQLMTEDCLFAGQSSSDEPDSSVSQ